MTRHRSLIAVALVAGGLVVAAAGVATASAPGNNGTVKVENATVDDLNDELPANHPHVQCPFAIRWYGFDEGTRSATVAFEAQEPSGTGAVTALSGATSLTFTGTGNGDNADHTEVYELDTTGLVAQENQGYHVKVTVTTDSSLGNDTKSKVFWMAPCAAPTESPTPTPEPTTPTPTPEPTTESPTVEPTTLTQSPTVTPSVLGVKIVKHLPFTGRPIGATTAVGVLLVLAGLGVLATTRVPRGAHQR
jgi:hypothetical protein